MALTDGDQIRGLLGTYCQLIDAGDFAGVGRLMADAVLMTDDGTVVATGAEEVTNLYVGLVTRHDDGTPGTQHVVANTVLEELDGGAIRARSAYLVFQAVADLPLQPIITGRYRDTFARTDDGWCFAERRFFVDLVGDLSRHLR